MNLDHLLAAVRSELETLHDKVQVPAGNKALLPTVWSSFANLLDKGAREHKTCFQRCQTASDDSSRWRT